MGLGEMSRAELVCMYVCMYVSTYVQKNPFINPEQDKDKDRNKQSLGGGSTRVEGVAMGLGFLSFVLFFCGRGELFM